MPNENIISVDKAKQELEQHALWLKFHWADNDDNSVNDAAVDKPWWVFINAKTRKNLKTAVRFTLDAVDDFVIVGLNLLGPDCVLKVRDYIIELLASVYDCVMAKVKLPLWLRPVSSVIRRVVLEILLPLLLDYFLYKYTSGVFKRV
jgi:hypothetical protein